MMLEAETIPAEVFHVLASDLRLELDSASDERDLKRSIAKWQDFATLLMKSFNRADAAKICEIITQILGRPNALKVAAVADSLDVEHTSEVFENLLRIARKPPDLSPLWDLADSLCGETGELMRDLLSAGESLRALRLARGL